MLKTKSSQIPLLSGYLEAFAIAASLLFLPAFWYVLHTFFQWPLWQTSLAVAGFPLAVLSLIVGINTLRRLYRILKYLGYPRYRRVLLVGASTSAETLISETLRNALYDLRVVGIVDDHIKGSFHSVPVLGTVSHLLRAAHTCKADEVVVTQRCTPEELRQITRMANWLRLDVRLTVNLPSSHYHPTDLSFIGPLPIITYATPHPNWAGSTLKRLLDTVFSGALLLITAPITLSIALLIRLTSRGPILSTELRAGLDGRAFPYYKFRTTYLQDTPNPLGVPAQASVIERLRNARTFTWVGRILHSYSLDSFPQLINVLRGDMSLVGPRPLPPKMIQPGNPYHRKRLTVRPGMVGPAQIHGKSILPSEAAMRWDVWYVVNNSLRQDIALLLQSFALPLRGIRAHQFLRLPVLGVLINTGRPKTFLQQLNNLSRHGHSAYVCFVNVHMLMEADQDPAFAEVVNSADIACPDGAPVARSVGWFYGLRQKRMPGPGVMPQLMAIAEREGKRVFVLGSMDDVLEGFVKRAGRDYPRLEIAGTYSPPFRTLSEEEQQEIVQRINDSRADMVFVALGCPKQEKWMAAHKGKVMACMYGLGFAIPAYAGHEKRAPKWIQAIGMEWFHRMLSDPKRLFSRYMGTNSAFVSKILRAKFFR